MRGVSGYWLHESSDSGQPGTSILTRMECESERLINIVQFAAQLVWQRNEEEERRAQVEIKWGIIA